VTLVNSTLSILIRAAIESDAEAVARVLFEAIRQTASASYPPAVIENWGRLPDEARYAQIRSAISGTDELCYVAEHAGEVVGFGSIVPSLSELRAVYVRPDVGRCGVGTAILGELERVATAQGLSELHMDASINAEAFYLRHGYESIEQGEHRMSNGVQMACVRMRKVMAERKGS
jgi:putative acetyltransferase